MGIGSKAGGIGGAAPPQAAADGENVLTKMLPGAAAEQAGKLGDGELLRPHNAYTQDTHRMANPNPNRPLINLHLNK